MMRLLCVSTAKNTDKILDEIRALENEDFSVVLHLGSKDADFKASAVSRLNQGVGLKGHLMENHKYSGAAAALMASPDFERHLEEFVDHLHRNGEINAFKSHPIRSMQDYFDYYHILTDTIAAMLIEKQVTHCLFFNIPHLTYDTIVFQVAQSLGIKTKIVTQSLFPNRFFSMEKPRDMGALLDFDGDAPPMEIEKGKKEELFYMAGIKQERESGGKVTAKAYLNLFVFLIMKRPLKALNPFYLHKVISNMKRIYGGFPKWRDPFARFFHEDALAYFDHLATFEDQEIDLSGDFVYFPLQMQPEMTTSSLGHAFRDQALAIERLADILPEGVRILVKENPKQSGYMRGPMFFHRLKRIPSVTFMPSYANTNALTDNAKFVATITGTVGWEAIRAGKVALVFGKAWYRKLSGAVEFSHGLTYEDISNATPDHDALQAEAGKLIGRTHEGVVDRHYARLVAEYDETENAKDVAKLLLSLLNDDVETTFGSEV